MTAAVAPSRACPNGLQCALSVPAWPMRAGLDALRRQPSRFGELAPAARQLWVQVFAATWRPHYVGRLPFCDAREVALACGVPLPVVRRHLDDLLACRALRVVAGGLVAEAPAWPS